MLILSAHPSQCTSAALAPSFFPVAAKTESAETLAGPADSGQLDYLDFDGADLAEYNYENDGCVFAELWQQACFFPQPRTFPFVSFFTGDDKPRSSALKPGFYNFECDCLDAPILIASGSIRSLRFLSHIYIGQQAYRHYRDVYDLWG